MPRYDRLSILVSLILFGFVVSQVIELPTRIISFVALGVPTTIYLSSRWFVGAIVVILAGTGTDSIVRSHPLAHDTDRGYSFSYWGLPCAFTLFAFFLLPLSTDMFFWLGGLALTGLCLSLIIIAQYHTIDQQDRYYDIARWGLNLVVYLIVFVFCTLVYGARARSLLSGSAILVLGATLSAELLRFRASRDGVRRTWLYALIVGVVLGEVVWALNHVSLSDPAGGIFLLLVFYVVSGLFRQHLRGRLARHVVVEFAIVSALGLGLLYLM
jgi:hypothetical protein